MLENSDLRIVARTPIGKHIVSTVFLVYDHAFNGPPALFETAIINEDLSMDEHLYRYHTWDEAVAGHNFVVNRLGKKYPKIEIVEMDEVSVAKEPSNTHQIRHIRVEESDLE